MTRWLLFLAAFHQFSQPIPFPPVPAPEPTPATPYERVEPMEVRS